MNTLTNLQILIDGPVQQRRQAMQTLIADTFSRDKILEHLTEIIVRQSEILYGPIPDGLKHDEPEKYKRMNEAAIVEQAAVQTVLGILGPDGLLDNERFIRLVDKSGMLDRLGRWQDHITTMYQRAAEIAEQFKRIHQNKTIQRVKIFGLGGSGAPHDIVAEIINNFRKTGIEITVIHADTPNPDYIDEHTLAIFSSFSGNTEETIHCYNVIRPKTDLLVLLAQGGQLQNIARRDSIPFIQFPERKTHSAYVIQPRESVCLQMTATLTFLGHMGLSPGSNGTFTIEDLALEEKILPLLTEWRKKVGPEVSFKDNPAKQLAFFLLYGIDYRGEGKLRTYDLWKKRVPFVLVDRNNSALGHEVRTQLHERSKLNVAYYEAPEFLHNLVESMRAEIESSQAGLDEERFVYYFVRSCDEEARIRLRLDKTIEFVIKDKRSYAIFNTGGENPYQRALCATYFNAHMTTYLAILNGFDPLPVPTMSWLKNVMKGFPRNDKEEQKLQAVKRSGLSINGS